MDPPELVLQVVQALHNLLNPDKKCETWMECKQVRVSVSECVRAHVWWLSMELADLVGVAVDDHCVDGQSHEGIQSSESPSTSKVGYYQESDN